MSFCRRYVAQIILESFIKSQFIQIILHDSIIFFFKNISVNAVHCHRVFINFVFSNLINEEERKNFYAFVKELAFPFQM